MLSVNVVAGKPKTSVELNYAYPNVEGGYDEYESDPFYLKGEAGYSCSISILKNDLLKQKERMFNLYVGGLFNFYMDYLSSSSIGWISAFSLNLNIFGELKLRNGSKITLHVFTPFIAYLSRPAWSVYNNEIIDASSESYSRIIFLGDFTSLNGLGRITAILNYEFILTKRISLDVGYEFSFVPSPVPRPIKTVVNNLNCGLTYHFQGR